MKGFRNIHFGLFALLVAMLSSSVSTVQAQTTSFTYQGRLMDGGVPANGAYDLQFQLFDALSGGGQQGGTVSLSAVSVTGGTFSVNLDFGSSVFPGADRWLQISVRPANTGGYTTLNPRQYITSTPYAIKSLGAATADALSSTALNSTNAFTMPQTIQTASGVAVPDNPGVVAAFESFYTGNNPNTAGVGIVGVVTDPNTQGAGVAGIVQSPNAVAGYFRNDASPGPILIASMGNSDTDVFDVFGNPNRGFGKVGIGSPNALATLTVAGSPLFPLTGTVSVTNNSNQVTGTGTLFGSEVGVGDRIQLAPNIGSIGVVAAVINDTSLTLASNWPGATTSGTFNDIPAMFRIDDPTGFTKLVLDGTGAVGIGNVAPIALLDVQGRALFRNRTVVSNNGNNQHPALLQVRAATFNALAGGTVSVTSGSNLVTAGPNTNFGSIGLGDKITVAGTIPSETHTVVSIFTNNTQMTVDAPFASTGSGATITPAAALFRTDDINGSTQFLISDTGSVSIGNGATALVPPDRLQVFGDIRLGTSTGNGCVKNFDGTAIMGTCSSDERLKTDIQPFAPTLEKLMQLTPVTYNWRADEHPEYHFGKERTSGLVAQEVEKVFPGMVGTDDRGYKAVNYSQLPLMLLQALKELKADSDHRESELMETVKQQRDQIEQLLSVIKGLQK